LQTVLLKPLRHRGAEVIGIYFKNDADLNLSVRRLTGVKWSQTNRCWYLPLSQQSYKLILGQFTNHAKLETKVLHEYLEKRKKVKATINPVPQKEDSKTIVSSPAWKLSTENAGCP
jgi:integrase/recombinase XerD